MDFDKLGLRGNNETLRSTVHRILDLVLQVGSLTMTKLSGEGLRSLAFGVTDVVALAGMPIKELSLLC